MKHSFGRTRMWELMNHEFLQEIMVKYHYNDCDKELLLRVASDVRSCMKDQECYEIVWEDPSYADVALTLGVGIDCLQEKYARADAVMKQCMAEHLCGELMMQQYGKLNEMLTEGIQCVVTGLHFWGAEEPYPISDMAKVLSKFRHIHLRCTRDDLLIPSKSVLYRVEFGKIEQQSSIIRWKEKGNHGTCRSMVCENCSRCWDGTCEQAEKNR